MSFVKIVLVAFSVAFLATVNAENVDLRKFIFEFTYGVMMGKFNLVQLRIFLRWTWNCYCFGDSSLEIF